jgi:hypothetical protein
MTTETTPEPPYTLDQARALLIPEGHCVIPYATGEDLRRMSWTETRLGARGSRE